MENKLNKWFIIVGIILALIILLISSVFIRLTPVFYIVPFFLILFGVLSYTKLSPKWIVIISIITIAIIIGILLFFSWMSQLPRELPGWA